MNTYTPELENQLIQYYRENTSQYFDKLKPFINYTDELKDVLLEKELDFCRSKQDKYDESKGTSINFFTTLLKHSCIQSTQALLTYLDSNNKYHQYEVDFNGRYWKGLLNRSKREYGLKNLLNQ
jgi:1,4-alpha-glucan branching enzyme